MEVSAVAGRDGLTWRCVCVALTLDGWTQSGASRAVAPRDDAVVVVADSSSADRSLILCVRPTMKDSDSVMRDDTVWRALVDAPNAMLVPCTDGVHVYELFWNTHESPDDALDRLRALPCLSAPSLSIARDWDEHEMVTAVSLSRRMAKSYGFMRRYIFKDASRMRQSTRAEQDAFRSSYRPQASLAADFESDEWWARRDLSERAYDATVTRKGRALRQCTVPDKRANDARISNARAKLTLQQRMYKARRAHDSSDNDDDASDDDSVL